MAKAAEVKFDKAEVARLMNLTGRANHQKKQNSKAYGNKTKSSSSEKEVTKVTESDDVVIEITMDKKLATVIWHELTNYSESSTYESLFTQCATEDFVQGDCVASSAATRKGSSTEINAAGVDGDSSEIHAGSVKGDISGIHAAGVEKDSSELHAGGVEEDSSGLPTAVEDITSDPERESELLEPSIILWSLIFKLVVEPPLDLPEGLGALGFIFVNRQDLGYFEIVKRELEEICQHKFPIVSELCALLRSFVNWVIEGYLPLKKLQPHSQHLFTYLQLHENVLRKQVYSILRDENFPQPAFLLFLLIAHFHILYLHEMMIVPIYPLALDGPSREKQLQLFARLYANHALKFLTRLWKFRFEGISRPVVNVNLVRNPGRKSGNSGKTYKLTTSFYDAYDNRNNPIITLTTTSNKSSLEKHKTALAKQAQNLSRKYLAIEFSNMNTSLNYPIECAADWLKFTITGFYDQSKFVTKVAQYDISQLDQIYENKINFFSPFKNQQSGTFSKFFTKCEIESNISNELSSYHSLLKDLAKDQYAYACCKVSVQIKNETLRYPLFEMMTLPE